MSFVSIEFFALLTITFCAYYLFSHVATQNLLIVVTSLVFYAAWDWRFVLLVVGLTAATYGAAICVETTKTQSSRRAWLVAFLCLVLIVLGFFKYFNFFVSSAATLAASVGLSTNSGSLEIILPLGISFMTFQAMAYVIDVYRGDCLADRDPVRVLAYKTFFPQLVAGPIERAGHLLEQFKAPRTLTSEKVARAVWLMVYGYALKVIFADSLAPIVDSLFQPDQQYGWSVIWGSIAFGIQIYADFCGYSLIAKGVALLFGFDLIWNFRFPYWSVSLSDFWRRWHIGLSSWLRDYIYIPLGGSRDGHITAGRNMIITMALGGLWHGASWNFVLWGLLHGFTQAAWRLFRFPASPTSLVGKATGWAVTMLVVFVGWFLFRASDWSTLTSMVRALVTWRWLDVHTELVRTLATIVAALALLEYFLIRKGDFFLIEGRKILLYPVMSAMVVVTVSLLGGNQPSFIYFEF
ncbi:MBOAT family O-acyltransferase [Devosia sp.]|uniref:MBOAT family O-acyltransferase n=1 Tax=Devosia sp. TaxID=1871048 RepID=UPI0025FCC4AC|nr:MBOAT family O-acyltransferase [Devosia sp.]MCR6636433.1 membrane-bound O-acyltransferase family protein [Devosia sp.]